MMQFKIAAELRKPAYDRAATEKKGAAGLYALASFGIAAAVGLSSCLDKPRPLRGDVAYIPIKDKAELVAIADNFFKTNLGVTMRHDVPITVEAGGKKITLEADGYSEDLKTGYEWTRGDYFSNTTAGKTLTMDDYNILAASTNTSPRLLLIGSDHKEGIEDFISYWTGQWKIKKTGN